MQIELTAKSEKLGKEWPVTVTIERYKMSTKHRVTSTTILLDGEQMSAELTERQGLYCVRIKGLAAKKAFGQSDVLIKMREGKETVSDAIVQLDEQAKAAEIAQIEGEGRLRYFIFVGGDTYRASVGMCAVTDEPNRYDALTSQDAPESVSCKGEIVNQDDYLAGRYGAVAIISRGRYEEILGITAQREQEKEAEREVAQREEEAKFEQARITGNRVELFHYTDGPCEEEGCIDTITVYAMPNGSRSEERYHSY